MSINFELLQNWYVCIYRVQNVFLRCLTPRLHCFLSSHWPSFRFVSFMAFFIPSIQFFFGLPRALFCFDIHFNVILGSLSSAILWTWPYHVSWFWSISLIIVSSSPVCCLIVIFPKLIKPRKQLTLRSKLLLPDRRYHHSLCVSGDSSWIATNLNRKCQWYSQ